MKVIEIQFDKSFKTYKYLLLNPACFTIDTANPLKYTCGAGKEYLYTVKMTIAKIYDVEELPSIVTSQIVITDDDNNVLVQPVGSTFEISRKEKPKEIPASKETKLSSKDKKEIDYMIFLAKLRGHIRAQCELHSAHRR